MKTKQIIPHEAIYSKILLIRSKKVMLDSDLAELYQVLTKNLNKAVKRNIERFPEDFMFQLTKEEASRFQFGTLKKVNPRSQFATLKQGQNVKYLPYVFTELGIAMLSSILNSDRAIQMNIYIMRAFTKLREIMATNTELRRKIEKLEEKYDKNFRVIFDTINHLLSEPNKPKEKFGFRVN